MGVNDWAQGERRLAMTMSLWVVIAAALIAVSGTIYTAHMTLRNNQNSLKQTLDMKMREIADGNEQESDTERESERGSNLAEARQLRDELKADREEIRAERDNLANELKAEQQRAIKSDEVSRAERAEFRIEISMLQAAQRDTDAAKSDNQAIIDGINKRHAGEIAKYKKQMLAFTATIVKLGIRVKEMEARVPTDPPAG